MHETESHSFQIRKLTLPDLPFCRHLVQEAGWNQVDTDWKRAMQLEPEGCFLAEINQEPVATTTTCRFGNVAWIAMVQVDKKARGNGTGIKMMQHAIGYLQSRNVATIRLDATPMGQGLYSKLGFKEEYEVIRFSRTPVSDEVVDLAKNHPVDTNTLRAIGAFDFEISGTQRFSLLQSFAENGSAPFFHRTESGRIMAYATARIGINAVQIGPALAPNAANGIDLMQKILSHFGRSSLFVDIPAENKQAVNWATSNGFTAQRHFMRMYLGKKLPDFPDFIWASSGPEKG